MLSRLRHPRPDTLRRSRRAAAALAAGLVGLAGLALVPPAADARQQPLKIAVVDLDLVFLQSSMGTSLQAEVKGLEESTRARLESELAAIQELEQRAAAASPEEQRELLRQREDRQLTVRRIRDDAARQVQKLEQDSRQRFSDAMKPVFEALQGERGWDLILNKTAGVVIFAGDSIDITELALERLNAAG